MRLIGHTILIAGLTAVGWIAGVTRPALTQAQHSDNGLLWAGGGFIVGAILAALFDISGSMQK